MQLSKRQPEELDLESSGTNCCATVVVRQNITDSFSFQNDTQLLVFELPVKRISVVNTIQTDLLLGKLYETVLFYRIIFKSLYEISGNVKEVERALIFLSKLH